MNESLKALRQENKLLEKHILKENNNDLSRVMTYLRSSHISEYNQECIRRDIYEMIIAAQERGEDIESLIGIDYQSFCDEIIGNYKPSKKQKMLEVLNTISYSLMWLCIITVVTSPKTFLIIQELVQNKKIDFQAEIPFSFGTIVVYSIIIIFMLSLVNFMTKNVFKSKQFFIRASFVIAIIVLVVLFIIALFGDATLFHINFAVALTLIVIFYVCHKLLSYQKSKLV